MLVIVALFLASCSDEKTPPDDENNRDAQIPMQKTNALTNCRYQAAEFHSCATMILENFSIKKEDRKYFSDCRLLILNNLSDSQALTDEMEAAKMNIINSCLN